MAFLSNSDATKISSANLMTNPAPFCFQQDEPPTGLLKREAAAAGNVLFPLVIHLHKRSADV